MFTCIFLSIVAVFLPNANILLTLVQGARANASVAGRVTVDNQPLAGITVTLELPLNVQGQKASAPLRPFTAKTDANGNYRITGIAGGYYLIWPRTMAYVMPIEGTSGRAGKTVNISDGESVEGVDFALVKGGVITGKVTDYLGRPVIAQRISLRRNVAEGRTVPFLSPLTGTAMFETDDRGAYRLFGLEIGRYSVSVGDDALSRTGKAYARTFFPGVRSERDAEFVVVTVGNETAKIDIKLPKPEKLYAAKGRLLDTETGKTLASMTMAYRLLSEASNLNGELSLKSETTDSQGEFIIQNLLPGKYAISIKTDIGNEYYATPVNFDIYDGDVSGVEVKAAKGVSVSGVVVVAGASDLAATKRLAEIRLQASLVEMQRPQFSTQVNSQALNPDGSFRLTGLRPGPNRISVIGNGMRLARIEREGKNIGERIELTAGENVTGIKVVMVVNGSGSVLGQVAVVNGVLRPDLQLLVFTRRLGETSTVGLSPAQVDSRGKFVIEGLMPGEYEFRLFSLTRTGMPGAGLRLPEAQKITVGSGETRVAFTVDLGEK